VATGILGLIKELFEVAKPLTTLGIGVTPYPKRSKTARYLMAMILKIRKY
jgi:hypothetical protein